ncbi:MAG: hypothetical protein ACRD0A_09650 [Acidimicrobiales bacterium]
MSPTTRKRPTAPAPIDHPALSQALVTLARAVDHQAVGEGEPPGYLHLALLVADVQRQLDDLTRLLIHYARRYEGTTWTQVAETFGISRPTVYKRYGEPSPNDLDHVEH